MKTAVPSFTFFAELSVLVQHINWGSHLGHDSVVTLMHEARVRYLKHLGHDEERLIVTHLEVDYKAEAFYGDTLHVGVTHRTKSPCSATLFYCAKRDETTVFSGTTNIAFFDYSTRKIIRGKL